MRLVLTAHEWNAVLDTANLNSDDLSKDYAIIKKTRQADDFSPTGLPTINIQSHEPGVPRFRSGFFFCHSSTISFSLSSSPSRQRAHPFAPRKRGANGIRDIEALKIAH